MTRALTEGGEPVDAVDVTATRAILAVQGPTARSLLSTVMPDAAAVGRFRNVAFDFDGDECLAAGTGYTGEDGVELRRAGRTRRRCLEAATSAGIEPAGLGAAGPLRLEAALPLHGHELGAGLSPLNAGLGWVVVWDKGTSGGAPRSSVNVTRE